MKPFLTLLLVITLLLSSGYGYTQTRQQEIDSLILLFKKSRHDWNDYAKQFIEIGEPAIPALVALLEDRNLSQWTRRIAAMTLNDMHSPLYIETALELLLDRNEDPTLRNQVTNGLKGHDLSYAVSDLWKVYSEEPDNSWFRSNIADILITSDTALAYKAFNEIYYANDGYLKQVALKKMVLLRPNESTCWYVQGLQTGDWMTANLAMDSLVLTDYFIPGELVVLYKQDGIPEEVRWRIVYVMGHREVPESLSLLLDALGDPSWLVCNEAAVGLSRLPAEKVLPAMKELLKDPDPRVVKNAKWVIRKRKIKN